MKCAKVSNAKISGIMVYTFTLKRFDLLPACFTTSERILQLDVPVASGNLVNCSHTALLGLFFEVVEVHGKVAAEGPASTRHQQDVTFSVDCACAQTC